LRHEQQDLEDKRRREARAAQQALDQAEKPDAQIELVQAQAAQDEREPGEL